MANSDLANEIIGTLVDKMENGDLVEASAPTLLKDDRPCSAWSFSNTLIRIFDGQTDDARTFNSWKAVGRMVKKGSKAFYILAPKMITKKETDERTGVETERRILVGFKALPEFRVEDTDGDPLPDVDPPSRPDLAKVADAWNVSITYGAIDGGFAYHAGEVDKDERIRCATHDEATFAHELAHAAHARILKDRGDKMVPGQDWKQEVVAEFTAAVLMSAYNLTDPARESWSFRYIRKYAENSGLKVEKAVLSVLGDVDKVTRLILDTAAENGVQAISTAA